jgi:hypothetical protein
MNQSGSEVEQPMYRPWEDHEELRPWDFSCLDVDKDFVSMNRKPDPDFAFAGPLAGF